MGYTKHFAVVAACVAGISLGSGARADDGAVALGGETFFVLKAPMDLDRTIGERTDGVYDRIRYVLNNPNLRARDIQVKRMGSYGAKIVANGQLIVPIGDAEAAAHGMTRMALARKWATHLREILPQLTAHPDSIARISDTGSAAIARR